MTLVQAYAAKEAGGKLEKFEYELGAIGYDDRRLLGQREQFYVVLKKGPLQISTKQ